MENITKNEILQFISDNKDYLFTHFHVTQIGIFGSFARGTQTENSDIDLLVEFEDGTQNRFKLKQEMRDYFYKIFHRDVDIARVKYLKPYAKEIILKETVYV